MPLDPAPVLLFGCFPERAARKIVVEHVAKRGAPACRDSWIDPSIEFGEGCLSATACFIKRNDVRGRDRDAACAAIGEVALHDIGLGVRLARAKDAEAAQFGVPVEHLTTGWVWCWQLLDSALGELETRHNGSAK